MNKKDAPKIEFPCQYSIRIMGDKSDEFTLKVVDIIQRHAPELTLDSATSKDSSKGRFMSVMVMITATGVPQLTAIHEDLKAYPAVKMVL